MLLMSRASQERMRLRQSVAYKISICEGAALISDVLHPSVIIMRIEVLFISKLFFLNKNGNILQSVFFIQS